MLCPKQGDSEGHTVDHQGFMDYGLGLPDIAACRGGQGRGWRAGHHDLPCGHPQVRGEDQPDLGLGAGAGEPRAGGMDRPSDLVRLPQGQLCMSPIGLFTT